MEKSMKIGFVLFRFFLLFFPYSKIIEKKLKIYVECVSGFVSAALDLFSTVQVYLTSRLRIIFPFFFVRLRRRLSFTHNTTENDKNRTLSQLTQLNALFFVDNNRHNNWNKIGAINSSFLRAPRLKKRTIWCIFSPVGSTTETFFVQKKMK